MVESKNNSVMGIPKFKKISDDDRKVLEYLKQSDGKGSDEWWELNKIWLKNYDYSLRVQLIFDFIETLIVPSGKGKGEPFVLRDFQKAFIKDVYNPVNKDLSRIVLRAILSEARKNGKGLALDTPIPTPSGWTTMGAIQCGDTLFDERGEQCKVTFVSDLRFLDCYEIEFSNGEKIVCDGDHLWLTTARVDTVGGNGNGRICRPKKVR